MTPWLKARPIGVQLGLALGLMAATGITATALAVTQLHRLATGTEALRAEAIEPLVTTARLQAEVQKVRVAYRDAAFDHLDRPAAIGRTLGGLGTVDSLSRQLARTSRDPSTLAAIQRFRDRWEALVPRVHVLLGTVSTASADHILRVLQGDLRTAMRAAETALVTVAERQEMTAAAFTAAAVATARRSAWVTTATLALGILLAGLTAAVIVRRITGTLATIGDRLRSLESHCLASLETATDALSRGDLDVRCERVTSPLHLDGNDELTQVSASLDSAILRTQSAIGSYERAVDALRGLLASTQSVIDAARRGDMSVRADDRQFAGAYGRLIEGFNAAQDATWQPVAAALDVLERVAQRDLSVRVAGTFPGDHARIANALNAAIANVAEALHEVEVAAEQIAGASEQVSSGSQSLAHSASHQAAGVEEMAAAMQEQAAITARTAEGLADARALTLTMRAELRTGTASMRSLADAMTRMNSSAAQTAHIVKTIDEIAFQTNLLALNAAVEAARAGDSGRGFAVVADEVRQLAIRAATAAGETATLIEQTVQSTRESAALTESVAGQIAEVDGQVERVTGLVQRLADDCAIQRDQIAEVTRAVEDVSGQTQIAAAGAEEAASASEELSAQAQMMRDLVNRFVVHRDPEHAPARTKARRHPSGDLPPTIRQRRRPEPFDTQPDHAVAQALAG